MRRLSPTILIILLTHVVMFGAQPWDVPFALNAAAVMKAASIVSASNASAILLLDEHHYEIDQEGERVSNFGAFIESSPQAR